MGYACLFRHSVQRRFHQGPQSAHSYNRIPKFSGPCHPQAA